MSKITTILCLFLGINTFVFGQQSIKQLILEVEKQEGTEQWESLLEIADSLTTSHNFEEANPFLERAEEYANKLDNPVLDFRTMYLRGDYLAQKSENEPGRIQMEKGLTMDQSEIPEGEMARFHFLLGMTSNNSGAFKQAEKHLKLAEKYYATKDNPYLVARVHMLQGSTYYMLSNYLASQKALTSAKNKFIEADRIHENLDAYQNLSAVCMLLGDYTAGLENSLEFLELIKKQDDPALLGNAYINVGACFQYLEDNEQALVNYKKSIAPREKINDEVGLCNSYMNIGQINMSLGNYKEAKKYLDQSLSLAIKTKNEQNEILVLGYLVDYAKQTGKMDEVIVSGQDYLKKARAMDYKAGIIQMKLNLTDYFVEKNELDSAKVYAQDVVRLSEETKQINFLSKANNKLYKIHKQEGTFEKALFHLEEYKNIEDSLFTEKGQERISEERVKQNTDDAEAARDKAVEEKTMLSKQNKAYLLAAIALLSLLLIGSYLYRQLRKSKVQIEAQNLQLAQLNETKDKFFGIIAHDIRSPITALQSVGEQMDYYLEKEDKNKLKTLTHNVGSTAGKLNKLLDNLLNWALLQTGVIPYHPKPISLNNTVEEVFALFQDMANTKNVSLKANVPEDHLVYADESSLNTILRNLVSNALKFTKAGGEVSITSEAKGKEYAIIVNDTGTGISAEGMEKLFSLERKSERGTQGEKGTGLGLILCKELVELNKGILNISSKLGKGSTFSFNLPSKA